MNRPFLLTLAAIAAFGCYQERDELDMDPSTSGGGTGTTTSSTAGSTTGSFSHDSGLSEATVVCDDLGTTLGTLTSELTTCGFPLPPFSQSQCLSQAASCTSTELQTLQTFLSCVDSVPAGSCQTLIVGLYGCEGPVSSVTCISLGTGGTGGSSNISSGGSVGSGSNNGIGTGGFTATATGGNGFGQGATATGGNGFGAVATATGGNGTGGRRGPPDGGGPGSTPYCGPCTTSMECGAPNACITDGTGQQVCGQDCSRGEPCPTGSTCEMTTNLRGRSVTQCVPAQCGSTFLDGGL